MKKALKNSAVLLVFSGAVPLIYGLILGLLLMKLPGMSVPAVTVPLAILFLLIWGICALLLSDPGRSALLQSLLMCALGLIMLALILFQSEVLGRYWFGFFGWLPQNYFLPAMPLAAFLSTKDSVAYAICFLVLFAVSWVGIRMKKARR